MLSDFPVQTEEFGSRPQPTPVLSLVQALAERDEVEITLVTLSDKVRDRTQTLAGAHKLVVLPRRRFSGGSLLNLPRVAQLHRELHRQRPDVVHAQGGENHYAQAAVTCDFPHVITIHGLMRDVLPITRPPRFSLARVPGLVERFVYKRMRNVINISPYTQRRLSDLSNVRWFSIPNAIDERFYSELPALRVREFVAAGTLYPLKGVHTVAAACRLLDQEGLSGKVRVFGGAFSPAGKEYRERVLEIAGRGKSFTFEIEDWAQPDQVAQAMRRSRAAIVASATENMSTVMAESLCSGTPVIATARGGSPDFLASGAGILFDFDDVLALASAMRAMLDDDDMWFAASGEAKRVSMAFKPMVVARQTVEAYQKIVGTM
jgi:glycosyltransferase involved in cell wall biosynthesis